MMRPRFLCEWSKVCVSDSRTVDKAATSVDSAWTNAQGTAVKAGRLLGDVLAQRVQGERPVVLVSKSVTFDRRSFAAFQLPSPNTNPAC